MKKVIVGVSFLALLVGGVLTPAAISRIAHTGDTSLTCQAATWNFKGFAADKTNTVRLKFLKNGVVVLDQDFSFVGATGSKTISTNLSGAGTFEARASWNTNGHQGSYTSNVGPFACETRTVTETISTTVTLPPVTGGQQTAPTPTTVTITLPAPPAQTVTTPAPPAVTTPGITQTVTTPPEIQVRTRTVPAKVVCAKGFHKAKGSCHKVKVVVKYRESKLCKPPKPQPVKPIKDCEGDCESVKRGANG